MKEAKEKVGADFFQDAFSEDGDSADEETTDFLSIDLEKEETKKDDSLEAAQKNDKDNLMDYIHEETQFRWNRALKDEEGVDKIEYVDPISEMRNGILDRLEAEKKRSVKDEGEPMDDERRELYIILEKKLEHWLELRGKLIKAQEKAGEIMLGEKVNPDDLKKSDEEVMMLYRKIKIITDRLTPEDVMLMQSFKDDKWDNKE